MTAKQLRWMQWAVRATLALGVAASVTANILHDQPNPISQAIAAWPPLALLITVELVTRVPAHRRTLGVIRIVAASAIAAIAARISYHTVGVVARYGETGTMPCLLPLSIDGLIIVASVSLIELTAAAANSTGDRNQHHLRHRPDRVRNPDHPRGRAVITAPRRQPIGRFCSSVSQPTPAPGGPPGEHASIDGKHTPTHYESGGERSHNPDAKPNFMIADTPQPTGILLMPAHDEHHS